MGLMDVLNGMQNGPRGARNPGAPSSGMSPITMAILGLLAYKAMNSLRQPSGNPASPGAGASPGGFPGINTGGLTGGLGGLLSGGLGGLLAGGAAGGMLSGGLNDLLNQFQQKGLGDIAKSWVGTGPNQAISTDQIEKALGADHISALAEQTGMNRDELLEGLSQHLPQVVDQLTPQGHVPQEVPL